MYNKFGTDPIIICLILERNQKNGYKENSLIMTWNYAYTPQIWPPVLMAVLMITLSVYCGRRRSVPGATALMVASLLAAAWAAGSFLEYAAVDLPDKITWFKFQAAAQIPIAIAITCFILEYAWPERWLTRRNLALLAFPGLLGVVMVLTDHLHHLTWSNFSLANGSIQPQFGPGSWLLLAYAFGVLGLVNVLVLGWLFRRSPQHRWPVILMLMGQLVGRMIFMMDRAHLVQSLLPLDLVGMSLEFLMYAIVLFGFRILDPMPLARRTVIQQLQTGMLVLDPQGKIISLNPAAQAILGRSEKHAVNHSIRELLPACVGLFEDLQAAGTSQVEISLLEGNSLGKTQGTARDGVGAGTEAREVQVEISPLKDWRGLGVGHLLLLHDVTEQKRTQAQLLDQQRALAMLNEREQLARELHDSIGQTLGFAGFQLEAATKLVQDGQAASAVAQLNRLAGIVRETHADVREYILDLHSAPAPQQPFFAALRRYLKGYTQNYGIQASLSIDEHLGDEPFSPDARMQVYRILQEALSNARKHSQAHCVQVSFTREDGSIRMTIQDDGAGFDPTQVAGEGHFGLKFMRERANQLGGSVVIHSTPGEGTRVVVEIPVNSSQ
jgi:PAS domain S-box-containing protein